MVERTCILYFKPREAGIFLILVCVIGFFFVVSLELVLSLMGENWPYQQVLGRQQITGQRFGPRYFEVNKHYKIAGAQLANPEVVALGTSRMLSLTASHLPAGVRFYNAAVVASISEGIDGWKEIITPLYASEELKTIVLGIDPWVFNPNYPGNRKPPKAKVIDFMKQTKGLDQAYFTYWLFKDHFLAYRELEKENVNFFPTLATSRQAFGLNALLYDAGYNADGSWSYPVKHLDEPVKDVNHWKSELAGDHYRFANSQDLGPQQVTQFRDFLSSTKAHGITVIGLMPPFRPDFFDAITLSPSQAGFFAAFRREIPAVMDEYGYICLDFSSAGDFGWKADDFHDNMHSKSDLFKKLFADYINNILLAS